MAIAALNGLDLNEAILKKDRAAAIRYHHTVNLEQFVKSKRHAQAE